MDVNQEDKNNSVPDCHAEFAKNVSKPYYCWSFKTNYIIVIMLFISFQFSWFSSMILYTTLQFGLI